MLKQLFSSVLVHTARGQYHYSLQFSFEEWLDTNICSYNFFSNQVPPETFQPTTESWKHYTTVRSPIT